MLTIQRGINMDCCPWENGKKLAQDKYMKIVKDAGFDHVRFPFPFQGGPLTTEGAEYYETIKQVCLLARKHGLVAFVDVHPYYSLNDDPYKFKEGFLNNWEALADYLKDLDSGVVFEIYNEPCGAFDYNLLNEFQNEAIERIRRTNPDRMIAAAVAHCNTIENLKHLKLPEDDRNIFVTIHDYTPMPFTHQGATWMEPSYPDNVPWGTDEEKALLKTRFDEAKAWADLHDRFIHLGEFGVYSAANMEDRCRWTAYMARLCEERGFAWCYWEFWVGFGAFDYETDSWREALLKALIP